MAGASEGVEMGEMGESTSPEWLAARVDHATASGIASAVAHLIREGRLAPGDQLPQVRPLAQELRVGPSTVSAAWLLLRQRGLVVGRGKAGMRVSHPVSGYAALQFAPTVSEWDLRAIYPDADLMPSLTDALGFAASQPNLNVYYRERILPDLSEAVVATWPFEPEALVAVNGISNGVWSALRSLSVPGDRIAIESPSQPPMIRIVKELGLIPVPVEVDADGPSPAALAAALKTRPVAFLYQPRAQVPAGVVVGEARRAELAEVLRRSACMVVEYDDLSELSTEPGCSLGALLPRRVLMVRSYEKSHGPDLRLAVAGGPASVVDSIHSHALLSQQWVSRILQCTLAWLIRDPGADGAVRLARETYALRRQALAAALAARGIPFGGPDGLCVWVPVTDEVAALGLLATNGVLAHAGSQSYPRTGRPHLRLATSRLRSGYDDIAALVAAAATERAPAVMAFPTARQ